MMMEEREKSAVRKAAHRRPPRPDPPPPPPPEASRNLRPRRDRPFVAGDFDSSSSSEDERRRKLKLVVKLPHCSDSSPAAISRRRRIPAPGSARAKNRPSAPASSDFESDSDSDSAASTSFSSSEEEDAVKPLKKRRRINGCDDDGFGSDGSGHLQESKKISSVPRSKGAISRTPPDTPKGTRMPDRRILEEVLDKLQKKDTYSVYAQPVDPEELPDYHEVIEHPMDFGTIRKKLARSAYRTFEQFEDDVFLICSNAMQYNAPHTIYFRQARAIEEMARKDFQILRADVKFIETERKSEEKIKFSSTEKKPLKKPLYRAEKDPLGSDISSSATLASGGDTYTRSSMGQANVLKKRRASACVNPAISNGSSTTRASAVEKDATSSGLTMVPANAIEKSAAANGVSKPQANAIKKPATSNGSSADQAKHVVKPSTDTTEQADVEKHATTNRSSTTQANTDENPETSNGLSITQANAVEKAGDANGLTTTRANVIEKPATSDGLSMIASIAAEKPATSNLSGTPQPNAAEQLTTANGFVDCSSSLDESKAERVDEFSAKCSPSKIGRKPQVVDENRRATYNQSEQQYVVESDSVFHVFDSEMKQLVDVGSHSEYSYARSLARFAAFLGPIGWEIVSKKIEKTLPSGVKFGPGWVGEYEPLPTPVLSLESHTQQQLRYGSNLQCRRTKTDEAELRSNATQNGESEDIRSDLKSQVNTGMLQRASHASERTVFCEQKQGLPGGSTENQPRLINAMLQQQKDQVAFDFASASIPMDKALRKSKLQSGAHKQNLFGVSADIQPRHVTSQQQRNQEAVNFTKTRNDVSEQVGMSNSYSPSSIPVEKAFRRPEFHSQAQNQGMFGVSDVTQPRITNAIFRKDIRTQNSSPSETALQKTLSHSETATSWPLGVIARSRNQLQPEPQKLAEIVNSQSGKDALGLTVGGLSSHKAGGSSDNNRAITSLEFASNKHSGVAGGSHERAIDFRLMDLSGKISNQPNYLNTSIYGAKQIMSPFPPPTRDDSSDASAATAARTWMSFGASAECRSVDSTNIVPTQIGSAWRPPTTTARFHGDSMIRPRIFPQPSPLVNEESQFQNRGLVFFPQLGAADLSRFHGPSPWQGLSPHAQSRQMDMLPPDLNIGFQNPGSPVRPSSGILVDSQQPDLALQL